MGDELRFDDQVAVVTGAGGSPGLGRSYARLLASRGARVVVNDLVLRSAEPGQGAEAVAAEIRELGGIAVTNGDSVASRDGARAIIDSALEQWGRVDILVNNAGVAPSALFDEISDVDIERVVSTHLMGHIWLSRAVWPAMSAQQSGRIVNTSSAVAWLGLPYHPIYAAAKLGVVGLTHALATTGAPLGIKVNAVAPSAATIGRLEAQSLIASILGEGNVPALSEDASPEVIAAVVAVLAHESCPFVGKTLDTEGGRVSEAFSLLTRGSQRDPDLTPETLLDRLDDVFDRTEATPFGPMLPGAVRR
jgi:NAD(P)-dependent dehydrogenase (short-subunit alcohol dehydrogenase family)